MGVSFFLMRKTMAELVTNKWFKMGADLMEQNVVYSVLKPISTRDNTKGNRFKCLIDLFIASASELGFHDVKHLSMRSGISVKQCQIVWDICIEENVLRETKRGWSAYAWLKEEGFVGDWEAKREAAKKQPPPLPAAKIEQERQSGFAGIYNDFVNRGR